MRAAVSARALSDAGYRRAVQNAAVRLLAHNIAGRCDLSQAIAAIDTAEAAGPVLDPTMLKDREVLDAVRDLAALGSGR